ncbi:uncharacterized protein [Ptychodera flava]|uniref:uncharacterized protein n=1 Tax=Ptychodera flava TaxID=63121 RepID=UPI00396AAADC
MEKKSKLSAIYCTVLDVELSEEQREDATRYGVTLITAIRHKWSKPDEDPPAITWLLNHNNYYPGLAKLEDITHVVGMYAKTHNAASAIHESLFPQAKLHLVPSKPAALFVGNSWSKDELGLTGFHRTLIQDFCERKAQAGEDLNAYSTVLDVKISDDQKEDAENCGVTLIPAQRSLGIEPKSDPPKTEWLLNHESYFPDLGKIEDIEYVVGYAPKTGHAAANIRAKLFPKAKLVLINHACPESDCLEAEEYGVLEFEEKMLQMASLADLLFSIGPVIYEYFQNAYRAEFHGKELSEIPHEEILPIPPACFRGKDPVLRETTIQCILTCGQLDTQKAIERCESMAASIGTAANHLSESQSPINPPSWKIQGVSQQADQTVVKFLSDKMQCRQIKPTLHPRHSAKSLHRSLQQSHLCLPAPCYVDYSLYGLEAMVSGLPTATYNHTHLACFIKKYLKEHADHCVVDDTGTKLSDRILKDLQDIPLAFQKAKALKTDLLQSEVISASCARFASLLTKDVKQQTGTYQKDHGVKKDEKDESKTSDAPEKSDEMSIKQQQTVSENKGTGNETSEPNTAVLNGKGNETDKSEVILPAADFLTVQIGLDENVQQQDLRELEEEVKALPAHVRQELMEEVMTTLRAALKRRVEDVLGDQDSCLEIKNACKQKLGDVDPSSLTAKSLAILLRFLTLYNLYRLKQTCRSGSLARAFEPLLITDEMREIAAKVGITLRLRATYDEKRFKDVELFFINRDGGGIKPMMTYDDVPAVDTDPLQLILLKLDPVHEIHQSTETNVCSLFKAEEYIRQKGSQFDIIQVVITMTDSIQHILSSRQEILSLLSVTRYLVTDVNFEDLTFPALTEKIILESQLAEALKKESQLEKQCQEYKQQYQNAEKVVTTQLSEIHNLREKLKTELEKKEKVINELRTKLEQVSDEQAGTELQKKAAESPKLGEKILSQTEQEVAKLREGLISYSTDTGNTLPSHNLPTFNEVSVHQVRTLIERAAPKSCDLDILPTNYIKKFASVLAPFITHLFNASLSSGVVPSHFKSAIIRPLLKNPDLDPNSLRNYRPVSNLPFLSKLLERVVASQLNIHLANHSLLTKFQSAYRAHHSTETALLRVHNDIMLALNEKKDVLLIMLDLSAAFDTVDHDVLLHRLQFRFGITVKLYHGSNPISTIVISV